MDILQTPETRERLPEAVTTPSITTARAGDGTYYDDDDGGEDDDDDKHHNSQGR